MPAPFRSLIATGTKLWLDSIDPDLLERFRPRGVTGATSNPIIVAGLLETGRFDNKLNDLFERYDVDEQVAWLMTDHLVHHAQKQFQDVFGKTAGNDGYVSFELDPLLEDPAADLAHEARVRQYIDLGQQWSEHQPNRLIKVPATPAGLDALEELAAAGVQLNVTLMFTQRQYEAARDAIWRGVQRFGKLDRYKSVYSIFISRVDVYTAKHVPDLSPAAQGQVGLVNAKRIWADNETFWQGKGLTRQQEIVFASTGTKLPEDPPDKYVRALAGGGIQTNPPETNEAVLSLGRTYKPTVTDMPDPDVLAEIDRLVDMDKLEKVLLEEGVKKFADPQKRLLQTIAHKRQLLAAG